MTRPLLLLSLLGATLACQAPPAPYAGRIDAPAGFGTDSDGRAAAWRAYAEARRDGPASGRYEGPSADPPPFEEEVQAREFMARVWGELTAKRGYSDRYLAELVQIQAAGFVREYTWECLHVLRGLRPPGLRMDEFRTWFAQTLPQHAVETWVDARVEQGELRLHVGRAAHERYVCEAGAAGG